MNTTVETDRAALFASVETLAQAARDGAIVSGRGPSSAKSRAFVAMFHAAHTGAAKMEDCGELTKLWHTASGNPLATKSEASANSKTMVWLKAGAKHGNRCVPGLAAFTSLAGETDKRSERFFEKATTYLRAEMASKEPLTEGEMLQILDPETEDKAALDKLHDFLKRANSAMDSAIKLEVPVQDCGVDVATLKADAARVADALATIARFVEVRDTKAKAEAAALAARVVAVSEPVQAPAPVSEPVEMAGHAGLFIGLAA